MNRFFCLVSLILFAVLLGCKTTSSDSSKGVVRTKAELNLESMQADASKKIPLFPEYFLLEGCEIIRQGTFEKNHFVAADIQTKRVLKSLFRQYITIFSKRGWAVTKMEKANQSFRFVTEKKNKHFEIRAVQGKQWVQMVVLYVP